MFCCVEAAVKGTETGMGLCMCVSLIHTVYVSNITLQFCGTVDQV